MILGRGERDGDGASVLIIGLSDENIRRLRAEQKPIRIRRVTHGDAIPEDMEIIILAGPTEEWLTHKLRQAGMANDTNIIRSNQLGKDSDT